MCFNPSGSMDYFGRLNAIDEIRIEAMFQSFWVNGLLWKIKNDLTRETERLFQSFWVNGLLWKYQVLHYGR